MKKTGIWLDKNKAIIVTLENDQESLQVVSSDIEDFRATSNRSEGGPLEIAKDKKYLEREKHQYKSYFKDIVAAVKHSDALVLFGPAQANKKFAKELSDNYNRLSAKVKAVETADSMTDNQVKAWVRNFYN